MLALHNRPATCEAAAATHSRRGRKRSFAAPITGLLLSIGIVTATFSTASAEIGVIGGNAPTTFSYTYSPEYKQIDVSCNSYDGLIQIRPYTAVQAGFFNGQYVSYRYQVKDRSTGWWSQSPWQGVTLAAGSGLNTTYPLNPLPVSYYRPGIHADWEVLVQVSYWNGWQWLYSGWYLPTHGMSSGGSSSSVHCYS